SMAFLMLMLGTLDFGRVIYKYSQLQNAVREGARYGKMNPAATNAIEAVVIDNASSMVVLPDDITVECTGGCYPGCADVTVGATAKFEFFTARLLGISDDFLPIMLHSSATVTAE
ncbi:MAG: pilus assembly protein, partial [Thermomicrobiales bacterium]|nr:pilus assembly protein [Thermomicrobiales bacterium]